MQPDSREKQIKSRVKKEIPFRKPLISMTDMFQVVEMIYDSNGNATDYLIREVNPVIERLLGKKKEQITGRRAKQVFGTVENFWIEVFSLVDKTGNPVRFRHFSNIFGKWFEIYAWRSDAGFIETIITDISEKRCLEEKLETEEQRFRAILNNSRDIIYCINLSTEKFEYLSPSIESITGYTVKEFESMDVDTLYSLVHPDYREALKQSYRDTIKHGETLTEYPFKTKSGEYRWLSSHKSISMDGNGTFYSNANVRDITDIKMNEDALIKSNALANERLREIENLYNTIPIGLCVFDLDLRFMRINEKMAEFNGTPAKDHIGRTVDEIVPALGDKARSLLKKILETGEPQLGIEMTGKTPAKPHLERSWTEEWVPVKDDNGEIVAINVAVVETTEEKKAKETLIRSERRLNGAKKALEYSQQKLRMLLENGRIGIWERDLRTDRVSWDLRTEEIFGFETGTFDNTLATFKSCIHEEDVPNLEDVVVNSVRTGNQYEVVYRTKPINGESNYISEKGFIIRDENGNPLKLMGICFDVSDLKRGAEQVIMKMNEELLRSNRELQQFAYVASHDLQEPLRMVSSFTQLLAMKYADKLDDDAREYIKYAVDGSKRMYDLLNGLLTYSRVQTKGKEFLPINMNRVVEKVRSNLHLLIEKTHTLIECENLPVINADECQMVQLIQNLIENGIKFNKGKPRIKIKAEMIDGFNVFSISDNGIGIELIYFDRIFRIFQRLHTSGQYPGTGIGLAICQRIVERHSGTIWVESKPGKGSVFYFSLPCKTIGI